MARQLFVKGQSGNPGGKPKGASKKKLMFKVGEILREQNFDPFYELIKLARETRSDKVRCDALTELCGYVAPKLKQIEVTTDQENPFVLNLNFGAPRKDEK